MADIPDVDLEVLDRETVVGYFPEAHTASQKIDNRLVKHKAGIYFQDIPTNPDDLAALPYDLAEKHGFYKVDLLSCPFPYEGLASMDELRDWLARPIDWDWFTDIEFVGKLFHLSGTVFLGESQFITMAEVVAHYEPKSIPDLACMVAIKMPAKKYLIGESWDTIHKMMWLRQPGEQFKKSHATAYALVVGLNARRQYVG
jgi:hypothetical protein